MRDIDKVWAPPTLESSIAYLEGVIKKNPFGVPAFEGFILEALKELQEIKTK
jgi:hypothetical protein